MSKRKLWLFSKHGNDVGDNAFAFYKYVIKNHPEIRCVFVVDKKCPEAYEEAKKEGEVVQFRSLRHKWFFLRADKIITSHVGDSEPWDYEKIIELREKHPGWAKRHRIIHLQHGVVDKNVSHIYSKKLRPVDLFISSTPAEKTYIEKTLGYEPQQVPCTGLARWDDLYDAKAERIILLIPRYRADVMVQLPENKKKLKYHFMCTQFYKKYQELLSDEKLAELLEKNDYKLIFYPHYEVQPLIGCFSTKCKRIQILDRSSVSLDELLKKSALMITDYSSVAFDFAYMRKPVIYYQFDREVFEAEYGGSYFNHERDGFGPVVNKKEKCISKIAGWLNGRFDMEDLYRERCMRTFPFYDRDNCKRVYEEVEREKEGRLL